VAIDSGSGNWQWQVTVTIGSGSGSLAVARTGQARHQEIDSGCGSLWQPGSDNGAQKRAGGWGLIGKYGVFYWKNGNFDRF
jgi:hypothetical protein